MAKKKKKRKVFSRILAAITVFIGLALFIAAGLLAVVIYFNTPQNPLAATEQDGIKRGDENEYFVEVRRGESAQSIGLRLERAGLIRSRHFWNLLCRYEKEFIKTGTYRLEVPISQIAIHRILVSGKQILFRVTIPEGVTLKKTAKIMEDAGICSASDFLEAANDPSAMSRYGVPNASMEGYLFPDTYLFPAEYPASQVIKSMADTFFDKLEKLVPSAHTLSRQEINNRVIIASIVEREYRLPDEAPLMAGVFFNRLDIGMALQSCATVEYIITEIEDKPHPKVLFNRDIEIRNPYNTYIMPGLPPGPISAPGATALSAAFFPENSDYLYFRLQNEGSGKHYFSKNLDEHIRAGQLLLKGRP
ncbi:MAG: endolytic transglycosylase MltG [Treponema sp.]|nr:endolytic transglycosylase MltG [Treponema sp.]